jgi:hypothetical protein
MLSTDLYKGRQRGGVHAWPFWATASTGGFPAVSVFHVPVVHYKHAHTVRY